MSTFDLNPISEDEMAALVSGEDTEIKDNEKKADTPIESDKHTEKPETAVILKNNNGDLPSLSEEEFTALSDEAEIEEGEENNKDSKLHNKDKSFLDRGQYYKMLVSSGEWVPVTDDKGNPVEDLELSDEEFQELAIKQAQWKAEDILAERENEAGEQYKAFFEFIKNGGKVEELAQFEAEQKDVELYDPSVPEDAEELIRAYKASKGESEKSIKRYIDYLKDMGTGDLEEMASEYKESLIKDIQEEKKALLESQEKKAKYIKETQEKYISDLKQVIHKQSIPDREKKELESFYFDLKEVSPEGQKISKWSLKVREVQEDPVKFLKVIQFFKDFDALENKKTTEEKVNKNLFNILRTPSINKDSYYLEESKNNKKINKPTTFDRFRKR